MIVKDDSLLIIDSYYVVEFSISESKYSEKEKCLRIFYRSDTPTKKDIKKFIKNQYSNLIKKDIKKIYYDEPWHFSASGSPYGLVFVFY